MPATPTYSPPTPQKSAEFLRPYPCRYARYAEIHPLPPLKGLPGTRATFVSYRAFVPAGHAGCGDALSYRALAPGGAGTWCRTCAGTSGVPQPTAHSSLLTVHSSFASGWQTFSYGKLGELTENIRTFAPPFENQTYTFNMYFEYDSWNRIQIITYPDGEKVTYGYNRGGMLESVIGDKNGDTYKYIEEIRYNPFEQKESVHYGNGTVTDYSYDVLLRLSHLHSVCADGTMQDIDYDYDEVSNINSIENLAGVLPNNLGGTYRSDYTYDNLYRLTYADGNWQGNNTLYYETSLDYERNGRISRKVLHADTWLDGNYATENYDNRYYYANSSQPNTLSYINDNPDQHFDWDLKGNMVYHYNGQSRYNRSLCWDEQNRLLGVKDEGKLLSYYLYDANGDRTYKFTGEYAAQNQSGQWHYYYLLNCPTLYASPYLVTNKKGYTKHYYAESERIASRIGGGGLQDLHKGFENYPDMVGKHKESSAKLFYKVMKCLDADALPQKDALKYLYEWLEVVEDEKDCYWYHPDHLGSSSWITYTDGSAVQHLHYLPWGEDFVDQRSSSWNAMFTFSAKEKDSETGLSYFGSRYYSSDLSVWLSVDPMSDKYASTSPYAYCRNNPIIMVDPNGEFDTRAEARRYRKEHHTGGIIKRNSRRDKFSGKFSIDNKREYVSYTKPQYVKDDASIPMIGQSSDGVVKSPIILDPRTRREKLDDFDRKAAQKGVAIGQGMATALPITSQINDIMILSKGENMFGDKATESDKVWATIDLATLGVGKTLKLFEEAGGPVVRKAADIIEDVGNGLNIRSWFVTTKNKWKNGKKRK